MNKTGDNLYSEYGIDENHNLWMVKRVIGRDERVLDGTIKCTNGKPELNWKVDTGKDNEKEVLDNIKYVN